MTSRFPRFLSLSIGALVLGGAVACGETPTHEATSPVAFEVHTVQGHAPAVAAHHWSYEGPEGPDHWGDLAPEYSLCRSGTRQAPLALSNADATVEKTLAPLAFEFPAAPLRLAKNGHGFDVSSPVDWQTDAPHLGGPYKLVAFHFHVPSEHTVDGKRFDAEMHFVHKNAHGERAVVALLFAAGAENAPLRAVFANIPKEGGGASTGAPVDLRSLLPSREPYFTYAGSLTTPPCSEGITWIVYGTPRSLSSSQLESLHATVHGDTDRPLQPRGARPVLRYVP